MDYLEDHLTNARTQINELHLAGDRRDQINHLVDQIEARLPVDFRGERLIMIQVIWIADGSVVHLISLENRRGRKKIDQPVEECA